MSWVRLFRLHLRRLSAANEIAETQRTASRKHGESSDEVDELEGMDD